MNTLELVRKPVHSKCYGIEIECFIPKPVADKAIDKFHGMFFAGRDGSIKAPGFRGIEFVSQPLPYNWLSKELFKLSKKFQWQVNESCGIHIHVSKKSLSCRRILALYDCINGLSDEEFQILFGRKPNNYCQIGSRKLSNKGICFDTAGIYTGRYNAVNLTNQHTIEFRMFSSGDAKWAVECLRRVRAMLSIKETKPTFDTLLQVMTK